MSYTRIILSYFVITRRGERALLHPAVAGKAELYVRITKISYRKKTDLSRSHFLQEREEKSRLILHDLGSACAEALRPHFFLKKDMMAKLFYPAKNCRIDPSPEHIKFYVLR